MAETEVTASGTVRFEDGDAPDEDAFASTHARGNATDYVERGCGFTPDHTAETLDIGSTGARANYVVVSDGDRAYNVYPDQETGISLPDTNGTNHVFVQYDRSANEIKYHVDNDDTAPSEPSVKIGTVDTANDTDTPLNRDPTLRAERASTVPDYVIHNNSGTYEARAHTSETYYQDTDIFALINTITSNEGFNRHIVIGPSTSSYFYSTTLNITGSGLRIDSAGMNNTIIKQSASANVDAIQYGPVSSDTFFVTLSHLSIDGNKSNNTSGKLLVTDNSGAGEPKDLHADHVFFKNAPEHALHLDHCWGYRLSDSLIEFSAEDGIRLEGATLSQMHLDSVFLSQQGGWGINTVGSSTTVRDMNWNVLARNNDSGGVHAATGEYRDSRLELIANDNGQGGTASGVEFGGATGNRSINNTVVVTANGNTDVGLDVLADAFENHITVQGTGNTNGLYKRSGGGRTVINNHGVNAGDPRTTGTWDTVSADVAHELGAAVIWDTNSTPDTPYLPSPGGTYIPAHPHEGSATLNFGTISADATAEKTVTVAGAAPGDTVMLGPPSGIEAGLMWSGYVGSNDTVTVRLHNTTGSGVDPASGTWTARVYNFST